MAIWKNCKADIYYRDGSSPCLRDPGYDVIIDENQIVVSYKEDGEYVVYEGINSGNGHYELKNSKGAGEAVLHRTPGNQILEGFWSEDGLYGMWAIFLDEAEEHIQ